MMRTLVPPPGGYIAAQDVLDAIEAQRARHMHRRQDGQGNWVSDVEATRNCPGCWSAHHALDALKREIEAAFVPMPVSPHAADRSPRPCCDTCTP